MKDSEIIPVLHALKSPTFFTLDSDFYERHLCHPGYCLAYLDVEDDEAAALIRRFLRHPSFDTQVKRMGKVVRIRSARLRIWQMRSQREQELKWASL